MVMQTAHVELESGKREVLGRCLKLLGSVLKKVYTSSTDLQDDSDLIATAIGALLEVVQKPILLDCMSGLGHHALGCLYYLTSTTPAARRQALQLLTVDKIEDLLRAALTWLEDESQPEMHWAIAARKATFAYLCIICLLHANMFGDNRLSLCAWLSFACYKFGWVLN